MQLARSTGNGTTPAAYNVTNIICGPDSGMMPIAVARRIISAVLLLIQWSISIYCRPMPTTSSTPNVHANIVGRCFLMICIHRCSSTKWSDPRSSTNSMITLSPANSTFIQSSLSRFIWKVFPWCSSWHSATAA